MRAWFLFLYCHGAILVGAFAREPSQLTLEALREQITTHVSQERFKGAQWGIKIFSLVPGATVFEINSESLLKPASNAKLFSGALALDALGSNYKIRTSLFAKGAPERGVLAGGLLVYGRGDPTFSSAFDSKNSSGLKKLVQAIKKAGVQRIEGDIVADSTYFSGPPFGTGWTWDDLQYYYGAEVTALALNDNVIDLELRPGEQGQPCRLMASSPFVELVNRTTTGAPKSRAYISMERPVGQNRVFVNGSLPKGYSGAWRDTVSVANVPFWFAVMLKEELAKNGVIVTGQPRAVAWPERSVTSGLKEIASVESLPIGTIVEKMMKVSQNLYAQLLLLQAASRDSEKVDEETGIKQLNEFMRRVGAEPREVRLDDGAGLSRSALVTPNAIVQLLRYMTRHTEAQAFRNALPEPGGDGTLRNRLTDLKGRLSAKTGSFRFVDTLAGYLKSAGGDELAFAIMLNAYDPPNGRSSRDEIDAVVRLAARLGKLQ